MTVVSVDSVTKSSPSMDTPSRPEDPFVPGVGPDRRKRRRGENGSTDRTGGRSQVCRHGEGLVVSWVDSPKSTSC